MDTAPKHQIPARTQVLVVGGGPGGSYAAAVMAREGLQVVILESQKFPRYHIGESMLASLRHFLRFIDLDEKFDAYGFTRKDGAAFKLNSHKREGYTDYLIGGPNNYAWNVIRAESDELMFQHAASCGALVFDATKVTALNFSGDPMSSRPLSARWSSENTSGTIAFDYLVDASGREGLMSAKYLKTRVFNQGLKNVAIWGYWTGCGLYGEGTPRRGSPFFEALKDESGWAWMIPLHNGRTSIGIVMNQDLSNSKKRTHPSGTPPPLLTHYKEQLSLAPGITHLIGTGELHTEIKSASDYSYSASSYGGEGYRIVGDAGAFIDPFFSSGVHLALTGGLAAASSICASFRGDCSEADAAKWHSDRVALSYTRFLIVVLSAYKQMRAQEQPVLSDVDEDNFDRAFAFFRPVIQGIADVDKHLSQAELARTIDFCTHAFEPTLPEERDAVLSKLKTCMQAPNATVDVLLDSTNITATTPTIGTTRNTKVVGVAWIKNIGKETTINLEAYNAELTKEEQKVLNHIKARTMMRTEDTLHIENFTADVIGGYLPRLERGSLGLAFA